MMTIQEIIALKAQGKTPQEVMQIMFMRSPRYKQAETQLKNMAQGRSPKEFITQLAKQNGLTQENMQAVNQIIEE